MWIIVKYFYSLLKPIVKRQVQYHNDKTIYTDRCFSIGVPRAIFKGAAGLRKERCIYKP